MHNGKRSRLFPPRRPAQITLRMILAVLLVVGLIMLLLDIRARSLSTAANTRVTELADDGVWDRAKIQNVIQREPSSVRELGGGLIETYNFGGGVPGRAYVVRVGYVEDNGRQLRYLDHGLNAANGDLNLENLITAHAQRLATPPVEEVVYADGPAEVAVGEAYHGLQQDVRIVLAFDGQSQLFAGTVANTTRDTLKRIAVGVQLDDGRMVGPASLGDLEPGSAFPVRLEVDEPRFGRWVAYVERELYPNETYNTLRNGARVTLAYNTEVGGFEGAVENTTDSVIPQLRVAVMLADGTELGPVILEEIQPESQQEVAFPNPEAQFTGWSVGIR